MPRFEFRLSGSSRPLGEWLTILFPRLDRAARRDLVEAGGIRIAGRTADRVSFPCPAGAHVEIDDLQIEAHVSPESSTQWFAWVDEPAWSSGAIGSAGELRFRVEDRVQGLAAIMLTGPPESAAEICRHLAGGGMPVAGDLLRGGLALRGGAALAPTQAVFEAFSVFEDPPWPVAVSRDEPLVLRVSSEAAGAVARGHAWILPDDASDSADSFRPGSEVRVEDRRGRVLGWAWTEGDRGIAARMVAVGDLKHKEVPSIESRVATAIRRRKSLFEGDPKLPATDCFRLIHGEADGFPGLFVDRLGPLLRMLVSSRASDGVRDRIVAALRAQLPVTPEGWPFSMLELLHLHANSNRTAAFDRVRWIEGGVDVLERAGAERHGAGFWVEERGLRFLVEPGWEEPTRTRPGFGLFLDQRENRERLAPLAARGGRWLNLFAHTGAFSVALLAAGAEEVVSVDLSSPYLSKLEANLEANRERGVEPKRHRTVQSDGRRFVEGLGDAERFAGIVIDPPTAAAAGKRYWSVRNDLEPLLRRCITLLDASGALLVTQNARGVELGLDQTLERLASRAQRRVDRLLRAAPSSDFPSLRGFPEGDAFEGYLIELSM